MPPVTDRDKQIVVDALREKGATSEEKGIPLEQVTNGAQKLDPHPRFKDKNHVGLVLKALEAEKKVKRKAGAKTAVYYLLQAEQPAEQAAEEIPESAINPYLIRDEETA